MHHGWEACGNCKLASSCSLFVFVERLRTDRRAVPLLADRVERVRPRSLRTLAIQYEAVIDDLESEGHQLISFLGLDWEPACLDCHRTDADGQND